MNSKQENKYITYKEFEDAILMHRKEASIQTKEAIVKAIRLEIIALREIAESTNDIRTKNQLTKRLERFERIYQNL